MTTVAQATEAIYQVFVDGTTLAAANYTFENEDYSPPSGETWARLVVRHSPGGQETLGPSGGRVFERRGRVMVQVFEPAPDPSLAGAPGGRASLDAQTQEILGIFEGVTLSGTTVRFTGESEPREIPSDGAWLGIVVGLPFVYTETK